MNPDRIYSQYRDDALADQIEAETYNSFVALPFEDSFRYKPRRVLDEVLTEAAKIANGHNIGGLKQFSNPNWIEATQTAVEITEEIITQILERHLFIADLTLCNPNVLLELGVALGLKPTAQIILIIDGPPTKLPFDIQGNSVIRYDSGDFLNEISAALIAAAQAYELEYSKHIKFLRNRLSSDAVWFMKHLNHHGVVNGDTASHLYHGGSDARVRYAIAESDLIRCRLVKTHNLPDSQNGELFGTSLTKLGIRFISETWPVN